MIHDQCPGTDRRVQRTGNLIGEMQAVAIGPKWTLANQRKADAEDGCVIRWVSDFGRTQGEKEGTCHFIP
jgi:hypothetical protein